MSRRDELAQAIGDDKFSQNLGVGSTDPYPVVKEPKSGSVELAGVPLRNKNSIVIPLEKLTPDPDQPRKHFSDAELDKLAESLKKEGQLQPIRVMKNPDKPRHFIVLMGERRFRAATRAGLETLDAIVEKKRLTEDEKRNVQWIENALREDLNPIEEALFFEEQLAARSCSIRELAASLHMQPSTISRAKKLLLLPEDIKAKVTTGELPPLVAYELAKIESSTEQRETLSRYEEGGLTATDIAKSTASSRNGGKKKPASPKTKKHTHAGIKFSAAMKSSHTNADLIEGLRVWLDKLESDGRTRRAA